MFKVAERNYHSITKGFKDYCNFGEFSLGHEENVILRELFHVVSCFPLHLMLYRGNLVYSLGFLLKEQSIEISWKWAGGISPPPGNTQIFFHSLCYFYNCN